MLICSRGRRASLLWSSTIVMCHAFSRNRPLGRRSLGSLYTRTTLDPCEQQDDETLDSNDSNIDWQYVLHIAEDAARQAGEIMRQTTGRIAVQKTKSNVRDIVTDSDVACQQVIRQTVEAVFPDHAFLGEEDVASGSDASMRALKNALDDKEGRLLWIVDPIDGTTNFQAGTLL